MLSSRVTVDTGTEHVSITRHFNLLDLVVVIVVAVAVFLPPRETYALDAAKGTDADRIALATAEARTLAHPDDGVAAAELGRRLTLAGHTDWAVEATAELGERAVRSPSRWRALLATSVAYAERLEATEALEWARRALDACHVAGASACPSEDEVRVDIYVQHLDAGVRSGINPRRNPEGFRAAGVDVIRSIHLNGQDPAPSGDRGSASP
jgi:hypothetical protein